MAGAGGKADDERASLATVGIDVGGTNIRAALVASDGAVLATVTVPTPHSAHALTLAIVRAVRELEKCRRVSAVGLAVAGFLNVERTTVRFAPHLPWIDAPVAADLTARLGLPVVLEHDANAAALAEYRYGAAAGGRNVVVVAVGTGIGAALLHEGQLYRGSFGVAPELGHIQVVPNGRACACGKRGCWERYCSGTALVDTTIEMLATDRKRATALDRADANGPDALTGQHVASAAQAGDPLAIAVMADFSRWLGIGLALVGDVFDPDVIVVGGGVARSAPLFLDSARTHYAEHATGAGHRPLAQVRCTQLGESAGMTGAAELARSAVIAQ